MAIECQQCGNASRALVYRRPAVDKHLVQQFRILLAIAAGISAWSAYQLYGDVTVVRQSVQEFVSYLLANPTLQNPAIRDGVRMAYNATNLLAGVAVAVMIAIPLRYGWLATRIHIGHPWTLRQVQIIATLGVALELARNGAMYYLSLHNEVLKFSFHGSFHFFAALALLWYARLRPVRDYFSTYTLTPKQNPTVSDGVGTESSA